MNAGTTIEFSVALDEDSQTDKRVGLNRRFLRVGIAAPVLLEGIPRGVTLFLLPDDDPAFTEHEVLAAADSARRGQDVYLRHVRVADLSEPPRPIGTEPGTRRATYDPDTGEVLTNQVLGDDGEWHDTDESLPTPRDDESDPSFRF